MTVNNNKQAVNLNSFRTLSAAIYMGVVGAEVFIVQPGFVQGMARYLHFSESNAGDIASAEMWGIALTTVLLTFFASRLDWHHVLRFSLVTMIVANVACIFTDHALAFGIWRFIAGFGAGGAVSLSFTVIGLTDKPDRNFGYYIMWVLFYGAVVLPAMPSIYQFVGMIGMLIFFAALPAAALLFMHRLPHSGEEHVQVEEDAVDLSWTYKGMAIASIFIYFVAQGVVWAYLFFIGTSGGGTEQQVANGLTASQFAGVAGGFTVAMLGHRAGRVAPLSLSILGSFVPLFFLFGQMGIIIYTAAVCVYNYSWNVANPYYMAVMASFDRTGRVVVYAVAGQMLGLANGPWIAARIISPGHYSGVIWLGIALFIVSLVLILPPVLRQHRLAVQPA